MENRIPRLGSVIGYAQALIDKSVEGGYQLFDYLKSCQDHENNLTVVVRTEDQSSIPSSFFKVITEAWVNITRGLPEHVNFNFN